MLFELAWRGLHRGDEPYREAFKHGELLGEGIRQVGRDAAVVFIG